MNLESAVGHRDLMHVGPYLITFDEAGADIEHRSTYARYRVQAETASNAVDFLKYHKRLIFAMMGNTPGELEAYSVQPHTEGRTS
jgi:hypothetical protein